jgi:hypothetical protein
MDTNLLADPYDLLRYPFVAFDFDTILPLTLTMSNVPGFEILILNNLLLDLENMLIWPHVGSLPVYGHRHNVRRANLSLPGALLLLFYDTVAFYHWLNLPPLREREIQTTAQKLRRFAPPVVSLPPVHVPQVMPCEKHFDISVVIRSTDVSSSSLSNRSQSVASARTDETPANVAFQLEGGEI